jgi:hypothetical protein
MKDLSVLKHLTASTLTREQANLAKSRGRTRLELYYKQIDELLKNIRHTQKKDALDWIRYCKDRDWGLLSQIYDRLTESGNADGLPGLALFLKIPGRSFALLPGMEQGDSRRTDRIYMASAWNSAALEAARDNHVEDTFNLAIVRTNRLWQRERWSVLPVEDTAEPSVLPVEDTAEPIGSSAAAYFNNISLHERPVDGWVDAFWGVQSGIRIPISIPGAQKSKFEVLLTTFVPDAFREWDGIETGYVKKIPPAVAKQIADSLQTKFEHELHGLSLTTSLLNDICGTEADLLASGMRMVAHFFHSDQTRPDWEKAVGMLLNRLRQIDPERYKTVEDLQHLRESAFKRLLTVSESMGEDLNSQDWKEKLKAEIATPQVPSLRLLYKQDHTIQDLVETLNSLVRDSESAIEPDLTPTDLGRLLPTDRIHPFLLLAILDNLVNRPKVHVQVSVFKTKESRETLHLTAFYPEWTLNLDDERDFLLRPLPLPPLGVHTGRTRPGYGFYLTAQVLWRCEGTIEYYRFGESTPVCPALIHLTLPLKGKPHQ